ncbi:MAG: flagellar biosynthetic protein FliO [Armatimonadota bacterium]|nr:flagellar biosynthetic protein FliO [Armatimonadota bacterium]
MCLLSLGPVCAAPPAAPAPASTTIPDYGGRDSAPLAAGDAAPNPAAQAGRAVEALVIVLAGVVGVVYALKHFGLVQGGADGKPARIMLSGLGRPFPRTAGSSEDLSSPVTVESSQVLPGGAMLHVVSVPGRTLLLAATGQTISAVADWPAEAETSDEAAAFEDYLARADVPETGIAAANARLRSLLSRPPSPKDTP